VPGQEGPHIEEDTMHPDITQSLVAERVREWQDRAARDRLVRDARNGRRTTPVSLTDLPRLRPGFGRHAAIVAADDHVAAADHRPSPGRRAA
jgi:hypothetical protein